MKFSEIFSICVGLLFVFSGMLLYSVIASPGYSAQQGQRVYTLMFAALLGLSLASIWLAASAFSR